MNPKRLLSTVCVAFLLTACSTKGTEAPVYSVSPNERATIDAVQIKLAEAAESVSHSLKRLAAVEESKAPPTRLPPPANAHKLGMTEIASVDWSGPVEPLLHQIAQATQYQLKVVGKNPAIPVIVNIYAQEKPLADILRDAQFQAIKETKIRVYPRSRVIELRYLTS